MRYIWKWKCSFLLWTKVAKFRQIWSHWVQIQDGISQNHADGCSLAVAMVAFLQKKYWLIKARAFWKSQQLLRISNPLPPPSSSSACAKLWKINKCAYLIFFLVYLKIMEMRCGAKQEVFSLEVRRCLKTKRDETPKVAKTNSMDGSSKEWLVGW